jgi:ferredoxin
MNKKFIPLLIFLCLILLLGAVMSTKPYVDRYFCVGCGDCVKHCPTGAVSLVSGRAVIDQATCIDCGFCVKTCNYNAIRRPK